MTMPRNTPGGRLCRKAVAFFATVAMNASASPPMMMFSSTHMAISRNAASTAVQPIVRTRVSKSDMMGTKWASEGWSSSPHPSTGGSDQRPLREQPHNDGDGDQADEAVFPEIADQRHDVADHAAEKRQSAADQQRRDNRQTQQHQPDIGQAGDPRLDARH